MKIKEELWNTSKKYWNNIKIAVLFQEENSMTAQMNVRTKGLIYVIIQRQLEKDLRITVWMIDV
jgi:hypothetical protein